MGKVLDFINNFNNKYIKNQRQIYEQKDIFYCPNCGMVIDNDSICPQCHTLLIVDTQDSNMNFKQFIKKYATELVLWKYTKPDKIIISDRDVPVYYKSECQIYNIKLFIKDLVKAGYLRNATELELLETLKIIELKAILKNANISQTGNKKDLIAKIVDNELYAHIYDEKEKYYVLSEKGKEFYEQNIEFVNLHRSQKYQITVKEYYDVRKKLPKNKGYSYQDCVWNIFQKRLLEYSKTRQYYQLYYNYLNMLDLTYSEGKYHVAINICLKCIIFDLCGVSYYNDLENYRKYNDKIFKKYLLDDINSCYINENNFALLSNMREYYTQESLIKEYETLEMNFKLCSLEVIKKIINDLIQNAQFNIKEYLPIIEHEHKRKIKKYL